MPERNRHRATVLLLCVVLSACSESSQPAQSPAEASGKLTVLTVNYPLAWMAEQIGGDTVSVRFPAPAGVDPAHWQPDVETILEYQRADLVLLNGAGYATWPSFAALAPSRTADTSRDLGDRLVIERAVTHRHGPTGDHDHGEVASHTWLDPTVAATQAAAVAAALAPHVPSADARLEAIQAGLAHLDASLATQLTGWADLGVLYSHPVFQYLDARYKLAGRSVVWEPDQAPDATAWAQLEALLQDAPATVMIWEAEPLPATRDRLAAMGIASVVFRTGARRPSEGDYLGLMQQNLERITTFNGSRHRSQDADDLG